MNQYEIYIGVDVSKASLELSGFDRKSHSIPNTKTGIQGLIRRVRRLQKSVLVCCEATGGYEKLLAAELLEAGISIAVVNAKRVRDFGRSKGLLAKTDRIDAKLLGDYAQVQQPRTVQPTASWQPTLQALLVRRDDILAMIKQEKSRLDPAPIPLVVKLIRKNLRSLQAQLKEIEQSIGQLRKSSPQLEALVQRITQVKGLGELSAVALLAFLPEIGRISDKEASALVGVAPFNRDSGNFRGQRHIAGGRAQLRKILYMAALSASKTNPILRAFYRQLRGREKPAKVALVAVMRKLVCLANQMIAEPEFQPS